MTNPIGQTQPVQVPNYSGVNIQIFNPSVYPHNGAGAQTNGGINAQTHTYSPATPQTAYPQNYYMQNFNNTNVPAQQTGQTQGQQGAQQAPVQQPAQPQANATNKSDKKTEKRKIVQLTDNYIKSIENYLNDPNNPQLRLMGAKEVVERLNEDSSRSKDLALNALVNKMLQDPSQDVRALALASLNTRIAEGDEATVAILHNIQQNDSGYGQDALEASQILLKMAGQTVEKEFEVPPGKEKK